jgi:hypothetical protein
VITDYHRAGMDGIEQAAAVKASAPTTRVIEPGLLDICKRSGFKFDQLNVRGIGFSANLRADICHLAYSARPGGRGRMTIYQGPSGGGAA